MIDENLLKWFRGERGTNKRILGDDFRENRTFVPLLGKIAAAVMDGGDIEKKRQERADAFMELQKKQIESRKTMFEKIGVDMPLPVLSREEWLSRIVPPDAWLYSQYGAILDENTDEWKNTDDVIEEERLPRISKDASELIDKLVIEGLTMEQICAPSEKPSGNAVPVLKKGETPSLNISKTPESPPEKGKEGGSPKTSSSAATTEKTSCTNNDGEEVDLLAKKRRIARRIREEKKRRKRKKIWFLTVTATLFLSALSLVIAKLLL